MTIHSIGRLELAISAVGEAPPAPLLALLHHFGKSELPRLIQACLVEEGLDRHTLTIDAIHIDLGAIDEGDLLQALVKPFMQQFSKALASIQTASDAKESEVPPIGDTQLHACITGFLRDGLFRGSFGTPDDALNGLIDSKPIGLLALLDAWLVDTAIRCRLARQFSRSTQRRILSIVRRRRIAGVPFTQVLERTSSVQRADDGLGIAKRHDARNVLDGRAIGVDITPEKRTEQPSGIPNGSGKRDASHDLPSPSGNQRVGVDDDLTHSMPQVTTADTIKFDGDRDVDSRASGWTGQSDDAGIHDRESQDARSKQPQTAFHRNRNTTPPGPFSVDRRDATIPPTHRSARIGHASEREDLADDASSRGTRVRIDESNAIEPTPFPHRDQRMPLVAAPDRASAMSGSRMTEPVGGRGARSADGVRSITRALPSTASRLSKPNLSHLDGLDFDLQVLCGLAAVHDLDADDPSRAIMIGAMEIPKAFVAAVYRFPQKRLLARAMVAHLSCSDLTVLANLLMTRTRASHVRSPIVERHERPRSGEEWHALFSNLLAQRYSIGRPCGRASTSNSPDEIVWSTGVDRSRMDQRRIGRRRRVDHGLSNNVSVLSAAMLETIPVGILRRLLTDHARHSGLLAALLNTAASEPEIAVSAWRAAIENLMSDALTRRSRHAFLGDIARRHATLTGTTPASFLERLRALSVDQSFVDTIDRAIVVIDRSGRRSRRSHRREADLTRKASVAQHASRCVIASIERIVRTLPVPICNEMIISLAGRHTAIVCARLEALESEPHMATMTRQAILTVVTASGERRQSRRRFMQDIVAAFTDMDLDLRRSTINGSAKGGDQTRGSTPLDVAQSREIAALLPLKEPPTSRLPAPGLAMNEDASQPSDLEGAIDDSFDTILIDDKSPTARRLMIVRQAGRHAPIALAFLDAARGSLARPTIEAVFLATRSPHRRPRDILVRSITEIAAHRAGLSLGAYCHAIGACSTDVIFLKGLGRVLSENTHLSIRSGTADAPLDRTNDPHDDDTYHISFLPALKDAIRRRPAELVTTLRAYRPRSLLVRAMRDHLPRGVLYDLVVLMACRDAQQTTALLEAADRVTHLSLPTWTATLGLLLARRSNGGFSRSALGRIVTKSARLAGLSINHYLSQLEEQYRTGHIATIAHRMARRSAYAERQKLIRARASQKDLARQSRQPVHLLVHALTDASSAIEDASAMQDMFIDIWSRMPTVVVAALRTNASHSSIAKAIVERISRSIRDEIVAMIAGRHAASVAALTAKFDDDPTIAIPSWEAALTVLLRHETRRGTRRGLIAAIMDHAAYRLRIPIDIYRARLRSRVPSSRWIADLPIEARSLVTRGEDRRGDAVTANPPPRAAGRNVSWVARDRRLTKMQEVVKIFFHILDHDTIPPWHKAPDLTTPGALLSSLLKTATRPIAMALSRRALTTGLDPACLERLARADARRLLRSLSGRHSTLITSLVDAAELSIERRSGEPTLVALDIALRKTARDIEPNVFCADFVASLAKTFSVLDQTVMARMRSVVAAGSSIDRRLALVASSHTQKRRLVRSRPLPSTFPRKRRLTLEAQHRRLDPLFDQRMTGTTDKSDLDWLTVTIANIGRRARRRSRLSRLDQAVEETSFGAGATTLSGSISTNTLLGFLWYGTVPVSVDEALSASMEKRFGKVAPKPHGQRYPVGAIGLVSRLRQLDDDSEKPPAPQKQDDAITIVITALKSDTDVAFRDKMQTLRQLIGKTLERSEARARLADAIELGSPEVLRRAALLLSSPPLYRTSPRLMARELASRHACDLFFYILARDALPWWHRVPVPARDVLAAQVRSHRHAIARAFVVQGHASEDARILVDRLGITGAMPLTRALAKRHFDLVKATVATSRQLLRDDNARWAAALETLLALRGRIEPSSFVAGLAARLADRVGGNAEAIAITLVDSSPVHKAALARSLAEARAGLLVAQGERSGFFGDPVQLPQDADCVALMRYHLRYGGSLVDIDSAVRDALATDATPAANMIQIAIVHPVARKRIATLPKATLILVLGALCHGGPRQLHALLQAMAANPSSIDLVLAAIGGGQTRIEPLVTIARATAGLTRASRRPLVQPGGSVQVDNAGLVILAPFFGRLFSGLDLLDDEKALPMAAAQRAVHVLQYLVNAETDALEHRLVLNKLLCGLDPAIPLIASISMDDRQTSLADGLLRSVIQNWPPLKSSTIAGLRDTFLRRDGLLRETPDAWVLTVTPGPFDMLLDRLPWPLSVVRLRWMPKLLTVEWR